MPWGAVVGAVASTVVGAALTDDDPGGAGAASGRASAAQERGIDAQTQIAQELHGYYKSTFQPFEKELVDVGKSFLGRIGTFGSPEEQELRAGEAHADVTQAYGRAREGLRRSAAGYGIQPGRLLHSELKLGLDEARSSSMAQNLARKGVRDEAFNKDLSVAGVGLNVAGLGRGLPSTAQTGLASATNASGQMASSQFLQSAFRQNQQAQGAAPIVNAVNKGLQKWWETPNTTTTTADPFSYNQEFTP